MPDREGREVEELMLKRKLSEAEQKGGYRMKIFGIGHSSRLIHPSSPFSMAILMLSVLLQLYSSLTSAFLVAFFWSTDICMMQPPTLYFDVIVDSFFLCEIFLNFISVRELIWN